MGAVAGFDGAASAACILRQPGMTSVAVAGRDHLLADDEGRFVVVVEDTKDRMASEIIMDLHQIPGVVSLTLTYHHFEEARPREARQPIAGGLMQ